MRYPKDVVDKAINLRMLGNTSAKINRILGLKVPKSTYAGWFKNIVLTIKAKKRISNETRLKLDKARVLAVAKNKLIRSKFLDSLDTINFDIANTIQDSNVAKIALSMLCLGEASKFKNGSAFSLGNTDPRIILLFIRLLRKCFDIDSSKFRCTVMCRADQNKAELENYWKNVTGIPEKQFYKTRVDSRTIGKKTLRSDYKGVLRVDYFDTKIQLELESLAELIYNRVCSVEKSMGL